MTNMNPSASREIIHRTAGQGHGPITRLMSPGDLGQYLKPFVFLDLFAGDMRLMSQAMGLHPHSGIATVTVFTEGDVTFNDPQDGQGTLTYGGVEWMRAGGGVWHGKELAAGTSDLMKGFQLWLALPPELENGPVQSQYLEAPAIPEVGPARVVLGAYQGAQSPVQAPAGINYLLVTLAPGENWTYAPPPEHSVGWLAISRGSLADRLHGDAGELLLFNPGEAPIDLVAGQEGATFVLGSAIPHRYPLHMGSHSVHTSPASLAAGERRIVELRHQLSRQSGAEGVQRAPFAG